MEQYYEYNKIEVGLDEPGRGCLFGPVSVAGVIWLDKDPDPSIEIKDSKQLSLNLDASLWLEPYYIWRKLIQEKNYDNFNSKNFSDQVINEIRKDFYNFYFKSNKDFLIEKEPRNISNFLIIKKIFPYSKFIFIKKKNLKDNLETILRKTNTRKKNNKWS